MIKKAVDFNKSRSIALLWEASDKKSGGFNKERSKALQWFNRGSTLRTRAREKAEPHGSRERSYHGARSNNNYEYNSVADYPNIICFLCQQV